MVTPSVRPGCFHRILEPDASTEYHTVSISSYFIIYHQSISIIFNHIQSEDIRRSIVVSTHFHTLPTGSPPVRDAALVMTPQRDKDPGVRKLWGDVWAKESYGALLTSLRVNPEQDSILELNCGPTVVNCIQEKGPVKKWMGYHAHAAGSKYSIIQNNVEEKLRLC